MIARNGLLAPVALGVGLTGILAAALMGGLRARGPTAEVENPVFDFGSADVSAAIACEFRIGNTGSADLALGNIRTDCACSDAEVDRRVVQRGASAVVRATLRTPGRGGPVQSRIVVTTNDPHHRLIPLRIVGRVRPTLQIVPATLYFCLLAKPEWRDERLRRATLYAWSDKQVAVEKAVSSVDWLTASFEPQAGGHRVLGRVQVRLNDLPPRDNDRAEVTIVARAGDETIQRTLTVLVDPP